MDAIFANPGSVPNGVSSGILETEVRFRIGRDQFQDIARRIEPTDLELSFSIVDAGFDASKPTRLERGQRQEPQKRPNRIRRIIFEGAKAVGDSYLTKEQLFNDDYRCGGQRAKISVSRETPIGRFDVPSWSIVRAKVRVSAVRGRWRIDLTAVIQAPYSTLGGGLKTMRDEIFGGIHTPADVAKLSDQRFKYEAEIEFMSGDDPRPYFGDLEAICDELFGGAGEATGKQVVPAHLMRDIAKIIGQRGSTIKQLGNQVTAVTRATWGEIYPPNGWFASVKYDGKRAFYYARGDTASVITAEGVIEWSRGDDSAPCLADGEWMADEGVMYLFDCMMYDDKPIVDAPYPVRRAKISDCVAADKSAKCLAKQFVELGDDWRDQLTAMWQAACDGSQTQPEGLIFTSREGSYSDCRSLKWKPVEHNSIDFLALKCSTALLGTAPYLPRADHTLYILFCGISESARKTYGITMLPRYETMVHEDGSYFPIQFAPSVQPLAHMWYVPDDGVTPHGKIAPHGKIVELRWAADSANWQFMRFRTDRESERGYFGNDFRVAEITFLNYIDVVKFDDLLSPPSTYFANDASTAYKPANAFKRIVIGGALRTYFTDEESILDAMSGRGADMFRYGTIGVRRLLMMELDAAAVAEAVRRKLEPRQKGHRGDTHQKLGIQIAAAVADMRLPAADLVQMATERGFAQGSCGIVCNFAIHYMCDSLESIVNFMKFVSQMCRPGAHFMFTTFSGSRIVEALKGRPQGDVVEWPESGVVKYAIGKLYAGDTLSQWGQMISVKLPFVAEMREEPLANIDAICAIADRVGFTKVIEKSFGEFDSSTLTMKLSDVDKEYIALHTIVVLRRRKDSAAKKM